MKQLLIAAVASMVLALPAYAVEKPVTSPTNIELAEQTTTTTTTTVEDCDVALKKCEGKETSDECKAVLTRCSKAN